MVTVEALAVTGMITVEAICTDPSRAAELPREEVIRLYQLAVVAQGALLPHLIGNAEPPIAPDVLLDVHQAAERMGVSIDYLYRHPGLPFRVRVGRHLKFSAKGLEQYIRTQQGRH